MATDNEVPDLLAALQEAVNRAREARREPEVVGWCNGPLYADTDPLDGDSVPDDDERPRYLGPPSSP